MITPTVIISLASIIISATSLISAIYWAKGNKSSGNEKLNLEKLEYWQGRENDLLEIIEKKDAKYQELYEDYMLASKIIIRAKDKGEL